MALRNGRFEKTINISDITGNLMVPAKAQSFFMSTSISPTSGRNVIRVVDGRNTMEFEVHVTRGGQMFLKRPWRLYSAYRRLEKDDLLTILPPTRDNQYVYEIRVSRRLVIQHVPQEGFEPEG